MAKKGSIYDRWGSEIPEQFKQEKQTEKDKKDFEKSAERIKNNKLFRDLIKGNQ